MGQSGTAEVGIVAMVISGNNRVIIAPIPVTRVILL
jgi:hypothetical protein